MRRAVMLRSGGLGIEVCRDGIVQQDTARCRETQTCLR